MKYRTNFRVKRMERGQGYGRKLLFLRNWDIGAGEHARLAVEEMVEAVKAALQPSAERAFDFKVVVSELINNEFMHGQGGSVRVSVAAYSSEYAELCVYGSNHGFSIEKELERRKGREDGWLDESGRGLVLAAALCETLKTETDDSGRVVRARICMGD